MVVDNDFVEKYEIGLYMMEHNDFFGTVKVMDEGIYIQGKVDMMGEQLPVFISISKESLQIPICRTEKYNTNTKESQKYGSFLMPIFEEGGNAMYPVSDAFMDAVESNTRKYYWTGTIVTGDK